MLETPHVVLGAAIATKIPNPYIAIPLAFASHFILERVPHWNPHLNTEIKKHGKVTKQSTIIVAIDVLLSLFLGTFIAIQVLPNSPHFWTIMVASFAAVLPDVMEGPYFFLGIKSNFIIKWIKFQKILQNDADIVLGLSTQVVTLIATFWWIFG